MGHAYVAQQLVSFRDADRRMRMWQSSSAGFPKSRKHNCSMPMSEALFRCLIDSQFLYSAKNPIFMGFPNIDLFRKLRVPPYRLAQTLICAIYDVKNRFVRAISSVIIGDENRHLLRIASETNYEDWNAGNL